MTGSSSCSSLIQGYSPPEHQRMACSLSLWVLLVLPTVFAHQPGLITIWSLLIDLSVLIMTVSSVEVAVDSGGFCNYSIITWKRTYKFKLKQLTWLGDKQNVTPPSSCTSVLTIYPSSAVEGAHLDSSSSHPVLSGWLKRDGGVLLGAGMLGIPRAPTRSKLAKRSKLQLSSKQVRHPLFISAEILMHVMKGLK